MPDIHDEYEGRLRRHMAAASRRIRGAYINSIQEISVQVDKIKWNGQTFSISQFPALKQRFDAVMAKMHTAVYTTVVNSVKASWDLSNKKNDIIVDRRIAERRPNKKVKQVLYDPNKAALDQFIKRKEKGLGLSDRVWNSIKPFRSELEAGLGLAVTNGKSAKTMAKDAVKYLNDPDKLFRRVRDEKGKLRLSKAAEAYHPGQGVYRSSFKNAMRLTRTENNMAYRTSDHERWKTMPFVTGIEIKLSGSHPRYDICDQVKGVYPKDFKFVGWHPQCLCYQVPKLLSPEEYDKLEDAILAGEELPSTAASQVTNPPAGFNDFVSNNRDRIEGWKNKPYWVKDNQGYYDNAPKKTKAKVVPLAPEAKSVPITTKSKDPDIDVLQQNDSFNNLLNASYNRGSLLKKQGEFTDFELEELLAIDMYGNTTYRQLNQYLRDPEYWGPDAFHENFRLLLDKALNKLPDFKGTVYRGVDIDGVTFEKYQQAFKNNVPIIDNAFMSTSREVSGAFDKDTFFVIESKTGKSIEKVLDDELELEVLFKSGSKFKITEISEKKISGKRRRLIKLEEI